jgi:hypothetical protein
MDDEIGMSKGYLIGINATTLYSVYMSPFSRVSLKRYSKPFKISVRR